MRRLQLVRTEWNHVRNIGSIAWRYDRFRAHPTKAGCDGVLDLLRERNAMIERLFPNGTARGIKDWPEIKLFGRPPLDVFRKNGHLRAIITVPLTWDVERMAKYRIVPGELMTSEERRAEMKKAGLKPLKGFHALDAKLPGCTYEPYPDGTGFRFGQGTNGWVRESTVMTVCDRPGFESDFTFRFWGARDGVAEVRDVTIEEVEP